MHPLDPTALPRLLTAVPGPRSAAWLARLRQCESPNVTAIASDFPIVWQEARGGAVRDCDGNVFVDATAAFGVALLGHGHPSVVAAVEQQARQLLHGMGDVHPSAQKVVLLEALQRLAPGDLGHGVLCTGGSEAVEVALKTALLATGKPGIIAFSGSYHGLGAGALAVTSRRDFRSPFAAQLAHHTVWVPFPRADRPPVGVAPPEVAAHVLQRVEDAIVHPALGGLPIGALIVEPVQGRGGSVVPPPGFLRDLAELCNRHGVLLIADEIFTGCGRTGTWWASDRAGVVPDLLCIGKALGGGLPIAACLGRPDIIAAWGESRGEALHTSTFLGNPLACAAAVASLHALEAEDIPQRCDAEGRNWLAALHQQLAGHPAVAAIRGQGLLLGVELRPCAQQSAGALAWRVVTGALQRGVLLLPCGTGGEVVQLTPPAILSAAQRAVVVEALGAALDEATR